MNQALKELGEYIPAQAARHAERVEFVHDQLIVWTSPESLLALMTFLRDDQRCQFRLLCDICGVDYPERAARFEVVYNLLSLNHNLRIRVKLAADEATAVPSITSLYSVAGWYEREAWDLYGIVFSDHPDLRRLLTDYGFTGHPFRKDFPLIGNVEVQYDPDRARVVYRPVSIVPRVLVPKVIRHDNRYDPALKDVQAPR